jgi:predicted amidohydrolase
MLCDVEANRALLAEAGRAAAHAGADLVVLPELANTGYVFRAGCAWVGGSAAPCAACLAAVSRRWGIEIDKRAVIST